jgi:hypothetical protein
MKATDFIDLDELVASCHSDDAQSFIQEAVASYRAGAYRAAIVATWIGIVYDFLHKLRQLEGAGDTNAAQKLADYESARTSSDFRTAMNFEESVIEWSRDDFEFITPQEQMDLERIREDRHRCAHPSMSTIDEPYQPSAELARLHIRNAVRVMLAHPPTQGAVAIGNLEKTIDGINFPTETNAAKIVLSTSALEYSRVSLKRNFTKLVTKALLKSHPEGSSLERYAAALNAALQMFRGECESSIHECIVGILISDDFQGIDRLILVCDLVHDFWSFLDNGQRELMKTRVRSVDDPQVLYAALRVEELRTAVQDGLGASVGSVDDDTMSIRDEVLADALQLHQSEDDPVPTYIVNAVVERFAASYSFTISMSRQNRLLYSVTHLLDDNNVAAILDAVRDNDQIRNAYTTRTLFRVLINDEKGTEDYFRSELRARGLDICAERWLPEDDPESEEEE